ncbi:MAG: chorismate-binding protein [Thermonemataceae bacterium]|nr:chorismate-binding protein [Thermonemataceae bacterium]
MEKIAKARSIAATYVTEAFEWACEHNFATAIWRLPKQKQLKTIIDFSENISLEKLDVETAQTGFVFSPFLNKIENAEGLKLIKAYFIKAMSIFDENLKDLPDEKLAKDEPEKNLLAYLKNFRKRTELSLPKVQLSQNNSESHIRLVEKAVKAIKKGDFQKIVISRKQTVCFEHTNWSVTDVVKKLAELYPDALISAVFIPNVGLWIGASPEILVSLDKNQIFRTMALAGTQVLPPQTPLSEVFWTQKEIEEQALVSRYIINAFKKIRLREFEEEGPRTVQAGNLVHLRTDFWVDLKEVAYPNLLGVMLALLHPTSAVCGMPKEESLQFLAEHEGYDRSFYSGFLGQINFDKETQIFVNLRCMEILSKTEAFLYAGGGITENSKPQKEWQETIAKMQTILKAFD